MADMNTLTAFLPALLIGSLLVACESEVVDTRADGALDISSSASSGSSGGGASEVVSPRMVSAGLMHACAIIAGGAVECWGSNLSGALGDDSTTDSLVPVDVVGLSSGARSIAVADAHTCAVTSGGGVECWGSNLVGALGDDSAIDSLVPVGVVGLSSGVIAVSAGAAHTCAVTSGGAVKCWGWNADGQLGDGSTTDSAVPVSVVGLSSGVVSVSAGGNHTCAVTSAGAVKCWGDNHEGPLGNGSMIDSAIPVDVTGLSSGVLAVSAGREHTCAVVSTGGIKCWGWNALGQLGNDSTADSPVPVDVMGLPSGILAVSGGVLHTCAVTAAGAVKCWGGNFLGQLGNGTTIDSLAPVDVVGLSSGDVAVSAGTGHTCALTSAGAVKCWGPSYHNGNSVSMYSSVPVEVMGL